MGEKDWSTVRVEFEPPTKAPRVAELEIPEPTESEVVATFLRAFEPSPTRRLFAVNED